MRSIVLTGGPGGGKSTLVRRLYAALPDRVVIVPEVATQLLGGQLFPWPENDEERLCVQRAIYSVQCELERVYRGRANDNTVLLFDRGTVDGAGYWPTGAEAFFEAMGMDADAERARYDAVVFCETAAAGGYSIQSDNSARREELAEAVGVDDRLREVWSRHPAFHFVAHVESFEGKLEAGERVLKRLIGDG